MSKSQFKKDKGAKIAAAKSDKHKKKKYSKTRFVVETRKTCGCCTAKMHFFSKESAKKAFQQAGLSSSSTITDDAGDVHNSIDTFYGFREGQANKLDYLIDLLRKKKSWPS